MIKLNGKPLDITKFPDNTTCVNVMDWDELPQVNVEFIYESHEDIINLMLFQDALSRERGIIHYCKTLSIQFFPFAQQDRICNEGEPLSCGVMANIVNL